MSSSPPPSLNSTSESQTSWSDVFAAGTAAILSASFEQANSDDAEDEEANEASLGNATAPSPKTIDQSQVPPRIVSTGEGFPTELAGSRSYPPDFPDSGPLIDANSSDGRDSSVQGTPEGNEDTGNLSEEDPGEWPAHIHGDHRASDAASALSSIPPPPPNYPPSPESVDSESLIRSAKGESKFFGASIEGYSSSLIETQPFEYGSSVGALVGQRGGNGDTQPADVAAGPSSSGIRGQTVSKGAGQNVLKISSEAGASNVHSAGQSKIDWEAVAKLAATESNKYPDENPLEKTVRTTHSPTGHSGHHIAFSSRQGQRVPQSPLSLHSKEDSGSPNGDENESTSSSSSGGNPNPWLIDAVAGALGPRGIAADLESLSERSHRSSKSQTSSSRTSPTKSVRSEKSHAAARCARTPGVSAASVASSKASQQSRRSQNSTASAKSIASDLLRLEAQLKAIGSARDGSPVKTTRSFGSHGNPVTPSPPKSTRYFGRRTRISVEAPPGRLGVILANRSDGKGTVVSALRTSSPLAGELSPGDRLEAIDGEDVSEMKVSDVTAIMARKADRGRTLTVVTPGKIRLGGPPTSFQSSGTTEPIPRSAPMGSVVVNGSG